jgi:hypothetical protein
VAQLSINDTPTLLCNRSIHVLFTRGLFRFNSASLDNNDRVENCATGVENADKTAGRFELIYARAETQFTSHGFATAEFILTYSQICG